MKNTGNHLREQRKSLGLTISEASLSTKISPKNLKAIEDGDLSQLPASSFLKGFLRAYSQYLKLNPDDVLQLFGEETASPQKKPPGAADPSPAVSDSDRHSLTSRNSLPPLSDSSRTVQIVSVLGIVFLIGTIVLVKNLVEKYEREAVVESPQGSMASGETVDETTNAAADTTAPEAQHKDSGGHDSKRDSLTTTADSSKVASGPSTAPTTTLPVAAPSAAGSPNVALPASPSTSTATATPAAAATAPHKAPLPTATTAVVSAPIPANSANPPTAATVGPAPAAIVNAKPPGGSGNSGSDGAVNARVPEVKTTPVAAATTQPQTTPGSDSTTPPAAVVLSDKPGELILEALDRVEVTVKSSNGDTKKLILQADEVHTLKTSGTVVLDLSDGGAVNLIVNGKDRGVPGDLGKPKKITLP